MNRSIIMIKDAFEPKYKNRDEVIITDYFNRKNFSILILTSSRDLNLISRKKIFFNIQDSNFISNKKIEILRSTSIRPFNLKTNIFLTNIINIFRFRYNYILAHVTGSYSSFLGIIFKTLNKNSVFFLKSDLNYLTYKRMLKNTLFRIIFTLPLYASDKIIVLSRTEKKMVDTLINNNQKTLVIPPFIHFNNFYTIYNSLIDIKLTRIGILARIARQKAHLSILQVSEKIANDFNLELFFAGDLDSDQEYSNMVLNKFKSGLGKQFHYLGFQNPENFYKLVQILLVPSIYESGSIVILEALASGKIVIARNLLIHREYIKHKENGFLFDKEEEIYDIIKFLFENPTEIKNITKNGILFSKKYDFSSNYRKLNELLKRSSN